jgi:hypothetical protein
VTVPLIIKSLRFRRVADQHSVIYLAPIPHRSSFWSSSEKSWVLAGLRSRTLLSARNR